MGGFLDSSERLVDIVLTVEGRRQLAAGKLEFVYYAFFDDEVDYSPIVSNSGSLSLTDLSGTVVEQIESSLVREALPGMASFRTSERNDSINVVKPLFTGPATRRVPELMMDPDVTSGSLVAAQVGGRPRKLQSFSLNFKVDGLSDIHDDGCTFDVIASGSDGVTPLIPKIDANGNIVVCPDIAVVIDGKKR